MMVFSSGSGRGVVVTKVRGAVPSLIPSIRLSQVAWARGHFASSSHQPKWCWGPRSIDGLSAE
jgi:hypothetical protein